MRFDVYCDESRPELFGSTNPEATYVVIGSVWLPTDAREPNKTAIHRLRNQHRVGGEVKWQKVSPSRLLFYRELVSLFSAESDLRFRCIAIDRNKVDLISFHESDPELGFYKFYYQLLHHWILDFNEYVIFCDFKVNRHRDRLHDLRRCLGYANLSAQIATVQATRSEESVLIQLADVLTGAIASKLNQSIGVNGARAQVIRMLEEQLGKHLGPTARSEQKFNVFKINFGGGW
jgi:hypothetical protein